MKTKRSFIIVDSSANHDAIYISESGENCRLIENAERFSKKADAEKVIQQKGWQNWAKIICKYL